MEWSECTPPVAGTRPASGAGTIQNPMQVITDPLTVHDHGQAMRHLRIAKTLCERCPQTGQRLGSRKLRGNAQRLMDIHALGSRHPILAAQIGGAR